MMLLAVALLIWVTTGIAAARKDRSLRLVSRRKGPRQSYLTIGLRIATVDRDPEVVTTQKIRRRLEPPELRPLGREGFGGAK